MRVVVISAVALPVILCGVLAAAAAIDALETSPSGTDAAAISADGTARADHTGGLPLPAVDGHGTPIDGKRPHLTVIDGSTTIVLPGSLAGTVSILPRAATPLPADAPSLEDAVGTVARAGGSDTTPDSPDLGSRPAIAPANPAPAAPAPPSHSMLSRSVQPHVVPPPAVSPAVVSPAPAEPPAPGEADDSEPSEAADSDPARDVIRPPGQTAGGRAKPGQIGPPPHASDTGPPDHADVTGPPPHANAGGNGAGNGRGAWYARINTVSSPR